MWCANQVASDDGQSLWLTDADSKGVRSVDEFKKAAIFWRSEHAQAALDLFLRRQGANAPHLAIVEIDHEILGEHSSIRPAG
jgi:hypothetical protein